MIRLLLFSLILSLPTTALAQEPDTVRLANVSVTDSVTLIRTYCPALIVTYSNPLSPFLPLQEHLRQVAGVQAAPYSGAPGASVVVRIRGAASLARNAQPLYVVDGVPTYRNMGESEMGRESTPFIFTPPPAGQPYGLNPLLNLPTADVESVTVLKGALATAQYGAQGQNGVISILTKQGQLNQPLRVSYSGYGGVQQVRRRYDLLTARQYAEWQNDLAQRFQQPTPYPPAELAALGRGTDWQREVLRTTTVQEHHLGLTGGKTSTRYYLGADYLRQNGIVENSHLNRYALRANVQQQLWPRATLDARVALSQADARLPDESLVGNMLTAQPTRPVRTARGELDFPGPLRVNPVWQALNRTREPRQRQALGRLELRQGLGQYLTASLLGQWELNELRRSGQNPPADPAQTDGGLQRTDKLRFQQLTVQAALDLRRTLAERHAFTAHLGFNPQHLENSVETSEIYLAAPGGPGFNRNSYARSTGNFFSLAGRAGYTYAGRYELQGSLRRDGTGWLTGERDWQWLPGAQFTWHADQESFLRGNRTIAALTAWVGWGQTANTGNFFGQNNRLIAAPGGSNTTTVVQLSQPELTTQLEAGISAGLWNHALTVEASIYQRRTVADAFLFSRTSPITSRIRARGLELSLTGLWLRQSTHWQASTTLGLAGQQSRYSSDAVYRASNVQVAADGNPLGTFSGLRYLGPDASGQPRYADLNQDGTINFLDYTALGSGLPTRLLTFSQQLRYRRLSLRAQADGAFGHQVYNSALLFLDNPGEFYGNGGSRLLGRWTPANPNTDVTAAGSSIATNSSYYLQSGNHIRLSALTLEYKVWEQGPRAVQMWVGGQNLLVISKYRGFDPGVSSGGADANQAGLDAGAYPTARTILLGVRATL